MPIQFTAKGIAKGVGFMLDNGNGSFVDWIFPSLESAVHYVEYRTPDVPEEEKPVVRKVIVTYRLVDMESQTKGYFVDATCKPQGKP
jgi:hypothetical protein